MRSFLTVVVIIGLVLFAGHLLREPTIENFLVQLWRQIHLTRQ
jgi:hypothetical protein